MLIKLILMNEERNGRTDAHSDTVSVGTYEMRAKHSIESSATGSSVGGGRSDVSAPHVVSMG